LVVSAGTLVKTFGAQEEISLGLGLHASEVVGEDLERDGHVADPAKHLGREVAVVRDAALPHERGVRGEALDEAGLVHLEHAVEVCPVGEDLD
jgi:hypothetical protein